MNGSYSTYTYSYRYRNTEWVFNLSATSWEDTEARLCAIKENGTVDGCVMATIPVSVGWWVPLLVAIRNGVRRIAHRRNTHGS